MTGIFTLEHMVRVALIFLAAYVSIMAQTLILAALFKPLVLRVAAECSQERYTNSLRGAVAMAEAVLVVVVLYRFGYLGLMVGAALAAPVIALLLVGFAGVSLRLGRALGGLHDRWVPSPLAGIWMGGTALMLVTSLPLLGWITIFTALFLGLGSAINVVFAEIRAAYGAWRAGPQEPRPGAAEMPSRRVP